MALEGAHYGVGTQTLPDLDPQVALFRLTTTLELAILRLCARAARDEGDPRQERQDDDVQPHSTLPVTFVVSTSTFHVAKGANGQDHHTLCHPSSDEIRQVRYPLAHETLRHFRLTSTFKALRGSPLTLGKTAHIRNLGSTAIIEDASWDGEECREPPWWNRESRRRDIGDDDNRIAAGASCRDGSRKTARHQNRIRTHDLRRFRNEQKNWINSGLALKRAASK